jgi:ribulose-bisphosphate carboxylase small chain
MQTAQIQAYSPFNGKKYETLSYLPPLTNEDIAKQITFMIKNHWTPCLEVSDDGDIYLNTAMGPNYYDNRYWSLYKLPMFGCTDPNEVIREIEACKREFSNAKVRVIAFDSKRQVQTAGFIVRK